MKAIKHTAVASLIRNTIHTDCSSCSAFFRAGSTITSHESSPFRRRRNFDFAEGPSRSCLFAARRPIHQPHRYPHVVSLCTLCVVIRYWTCIKEPSLWEANTVGRKHTRSPSIIRPGLLRVLNNTCVLYTSKNKIKTTFIVRVLCTSTVSALRAY